MIIVADGILRIVNPTLSEQKIVEASIGRQEINLEVIDADGRYSAYEYTKGLGGEGWNSPESSLVPEGGLIIGNQPVTVG